MTPESALAWRVSSYSGEQGACVEVAYGQSIGVRDTKDRDGGHLAVTATAWRSFTASVKHNH